MRSYVKVNGKKVYGNWSAKKSVKIKNKIIKMAAFL